MQDWRWSETIDEWVGYYFWSYDLLHAGYVLHAFLGHRTHCNSFPVSSPTANLAQIGCNV